jgi:Cu+-exporting ATPase
LPRVTLVAFDKTGTLTEGRPEVRAITPKAGESADHVLRLAASLEAVSEHALARGIVAAAQARGLAPWPARDVRVEPGRGILGRVATPEGEVQVAVGSPAWLGEAPGLAQVAVRVGGLGEGGAGGRVLGTLTLEDRPRASARAALAALAAEGATLRVLSGDTQAAASSLAERLGLPAAAAEGGLLPGAKVERLRALSLEVHAAGGAVAFVGDGINDAPALAAADLGIAVGSGTDLARETASVSLLGDDLTRLAGLLKAARRTRAAVRWNLFWAFAYNVAAVSWAVLAHPAPVLGALAMVVSSLFVIGTSLRLRARLSLDLNAPSGAPPAPPGA